MSKIVSILKTIAPWIITALALVYVFSGINWEFFFDKVKSANYVLLFCAVLLTVASYLIRAYRWEYFFPKKPFSYFFAYKVLILGFFMNNILPARAGELVRAHLGSKFSNMKRTLVLATVASERLADGLTISLMFLLTVGVISKFHEVTIPSGLYFVSYLFGLACLCVLFVLFLRKYIFGVLDLFSKKYPKKSIQYLVERIKIFLDGLEPLFQLKKLLPIVSISVLVWIVELLVFYVVGKSYHANLNMSHAVIFMVAVNFSSLIPAAPGGIGVIEAAATVVLTSMGLEHETALALVLSQHIIQYIVIGVPGAFFAATLKDRLELLKSTEELDD